MMRELIKCHLDDPAVQHGKVGFTRKPADGEDGIKGNCDVCGEELEYVKDALYPILAVACRGCEPKWIPAVQVSPRQADAPVETCDECGGPRKGKGFSHAEDCSAAPTPQAPKVVETCDQCGGARRGRGFMHTDECPARPQPQQEKKDLPKCESCGGTKRGRGFSHEPDCPVLKERQAKQAAQTPKRTRAKARPKGRRPRL